MRYSFLQFAADVMGRLGEMARAPAQSVRLSALPGVPWPEDVISLKVTSLLGEVGSSLIMNAPRERLGSGLRIETEPRIRLMPCGMYGAELRLPVDFLCLMSVRMSGWTRSVETLILPGTPEWSRQWSREPGIAGCPGRPLAFLDRDGDGLMIRVIGSEDPDDSLSWLSLWRVPAVDEEGGFDFPEALYADLVAAVAENIKT
ncbi:MAG: hypothetical protein K2N09_03380 [Muribaculaceae bacterium]|nr:hypothetical protein [Muribaculaceae bacterium]